MTGVVNTRGVIVGRDSARLPILGNCPDSFASNMSPIAPLSTPFTEYKSHEFYWSNETFWAGGDSRYSISAALVVGLHGMTVWSSLLRFVGHRDIGRKVARRHCKSPKKHSLYPPTFPPRNCLPFPFRLVRVLVYGSSFTIVAQGIQSVFTAGPIELQ